MMPSSCRVLWNKASKLLAQAAGQYLAAMKPKPRTIGVSWGRTMAAVAQWLPPNWADGVTVVQINGTVAPTPGIAHYNNVAEIFARKGNGRMIPLPVPAIVGEAITREVLERDRIVADVLRSARSAQVLVFLAGQRGRRFRADALGQCAAVRDDIAGRGRRRRRSAGSFHQPSRQRSSTRNSTQEPSGLSLSNLRNRDRVIGVAVGAAKQKVTLGALKAGLINVLITDEAGKPIRIGACT